MRRNLLMHAVSHRSKSSAKTAFLAFDLSSHNFLQSRAVLFVGLKSFHTKAGKMLETQSNTLPLLTPGVNRLFGELERSVLAMLVAQEFSGYDQAADCIARTTTTENIEDLHVGWSPFET